jgi:hypothetical protein
MNTREAIEKYGERALVCAVATIIRINERPGISVVAAYKQAKRATDRSLEKGNPDRPYRQEVEKILLNRRTFRG